MIKDPIVEEVHRAREKLVDMFDGDMEKLYEYLCQQQEKRNRKLVTEEMMDKQRAEENALT